MFLFKSKRCILMIIHHRADGKGLMDAKPLPININVAYKYKEELGGRKKLATMLVDHYHACSARPVLLSADKHAANIPIFFGCVTLDNP